MRVRGGVVGGLAALVVALAGAGCDASGPAADRTVVRDSAGVTIVENGPLADLPACAVDPAPTVSIGRARGEDAYQLYRVFGARRLSDGRIAVVNQGSQELRLYDADGRFLRASGREGEGPGEFRDAFQLWIRPGDTIVVGDYRPWRYHVFAPDGEWVRTVTPEPLYPNPPDVGVLEDGRVVLGMGERPREGTDFRPEHLHLMVHGADGTLRDTLGVWRSGSYGKPIPEPSAMWVYPFFEAFTRFAAADERIALTTSEEPEIRLLDPEGVVTSIIRWDAGDRAVSAEDVAAARRDFEEQYADLDAGTRRQLVEPLITEDRPASDRFPTVAGLEFGRDGRLWMRRYPRPGHTPGERWVGFAPDGRVTCEVALPEGFDPYEFGADYVLGDTRDELDVERVVLYGLKPPEPRPK